MKPRQMQQHDFDKVKIICPYNYNPKLQLCKGIQEGHMFK